MQSTQIVLAARPDGEPTAADFETVTVDLPPLEDGQVLLRVRYLSLDPYMRGRMSEAESYADPVSIGDVMVGATVCEVLESRSSRRAVGDLVLSYSGWQTHAVADARAMRSLDPDAAPVVDGARGAGHAGVHGVRRAPRCSASRRPARPSWSPPPPDRSAPRSGQIAKIKGARAVGIAGGPEKCRALVEEFGFDAAVDHRAPDFRDRLADAVPTASTSTSRTSAERWPAPCCGT